MSAAIVDSSALVAVFGIGQAHAQRYGRMLEAAAQEGWSLVTTWPCLVEASYLLDVPQRYTLLKWVAAGGITVYPLGQEVLDDMVEWMMQYTERPRTEMDLADASLVWLAHDTGVTRVMTLDMRDFSRYRLPDGRSFEIL